MPVLVLLRHGESLWNLENRFTGWTDVDLSEKGRAEASRAGRLLAQAGLPLAVGYTSVLKRAIRTLWLALDAMDRLWLPYGVSWRLNERHYGALQGLDKAETAERYGKVQVQIWRRSYDTPPPALAPDDPRHPRRDPRYAGERPEDLPGADSLKNTLQRLMPFWQRELRPALERQPGVLVAAHGNSLRALLKHLMDVPDSEIPGVEIPTGNPLVLELSRELAVRKASYLDPKRAAPLPGRG